MSLFNPETMKDFYKEAATVMSFDHENILFCLGISTESGEAPYLVFEYMQLGDLATILRQSQENQFSNKYFLDPLLTLDQVSNAYLHNYFNIHICPSLRRWHWRRRLVTSHFQVSSQLEVQKPSQMAAEQGKA